MALASRATVTAEQFAGVTGWIPAIDVSKVNAAFAIAGLSGNFQSQLAVRTADAARGRSTGTSCEAFHG